MAMVTVRALRSDGRRHDVARRDPLPRHGEQAVDRLIGELGQPARVVRRRGHHVQRFEPEDRDEGLHRVVGEHAPTYRLLKKVKTKYKPSDICNIVLNNEEYHEAIIDIMENSIYFEKESNNRSLFFKAKGEVKKTDDTKYYISTIQTILSSFGINLKRGKRFRIDKQLVYKYSLSVTTQIKDIVDFKNKLINKVPDFPNIFERDGV